jgi:Flp pilus assembly protein TadD
MAIQMSPLMVDPYTNIGNLYKDVGKLEDAIVYYKRAADLDPNNHISFANLGVSLIIIIIRYRMH